MGTLGQYLKSAREAKEVDLRDAAQQTRISINYLKALEEEDFSKLPGEVFVRGFLKNYVRFLNLDEAESLKRYAELKPQVQQTAPGQTPASLTASATQEKKKTPVEPASRRETPIEPFIWAAVICISLLVFLFSALPLRHLKKSAQPENTAVPVISGAPQDPVLAASLKPEKLYLEVIALEDTWLLVRTDTSPQKKAVLKKGESLIWSAEERFLLSYGRVGDVKLLLNGEEVAVRGARETPIRDLAITRTGVMNQPAPAKPAQPARPRVKTVSQTSVPVPAVSAPAPPPAPAAPDPVAVQPQAPAAVQTETPAQ